MNQKFTFIITLLSVSLFSSNVFAWGNHYLITDRLMEHSSMKFAEEKVPVESLDSFVKAEKEGLKTFFQDYYDWMEKSGKSRFKRVDFDPKKASEREFLHASRLNPDANIPLVRRLLPGEKAQYRKVPMLQVSWVFKDYDPIFAMDFEDVRGRKVSIRSILVTFIDEPDWGFDHELWGFEDYGYGKQPYGEPTGESSKAPFHMQFDHENFLVRTFARNIAEGGMVDQRIDFFQRMAKFAKETGHPYWSYRFAAWANHYIQDLCQPYHSKALPSGGFWYYTKYVWKSIIAMITGDKSGPMEMQAQAQQLVKNRHFAYEDFVSYGMQEFYLAPKPIYEKLSKYPYEGEAYFASVENAMDLMDTVTETAADHSSKTDSAIVTAFGPKMTEDPTYDLESDPAYSITVVLDKLTKAQEEELLDETGKDFINTGRSTRTFLKITGLVPESN